MDGDCVFLFLYYLGENYRIGYHCTKGADTVGKEKRCNRSTEQIPYYGCLKRTQAKSEDKADNHCAVGAFKRAKAKRKHFHQACYKMCKANNG